MTQKHIYQAKTMTETHKADSETEMFTDSP